MDLELRKLVRQQRKAVLAKKVWHSVAWMVLGVAIALGFLALDHDKTIPARSFGRILTVVPLVVSLFVFLNRLGLYQQELMEEREEGKGPLIQTLNLDGKAQTEEREYDELKPL